MLYPLKFKPLLKERVWGGENLKEMYADAVLPNMKEVGESWLVSGVQDNISLVANGFLKDNTLEELVEVYMGDLVGDSVYEKFGVEFPLLIKLIDTREYLSVQVHPDDEMAKERHSAYGKSEFWYVLESKDDSEIITGFNRSFTRDDYVSSIKDKTLISSLKNEAVVPHNFVFIPSGSLHSLGKNILLVEIQQTSDITYRVYDWDRVDEQGKGRELHIELAADTIDFSRNPLEIKSLDMDKNKAQELVENTFFRINRFYIDEPLNREFIDFDTFRLYICISGTAEVHSVGNNPVILSKGEVVLVPASLHVVELIPNEESLLLEAYVP